MRTTLRHLLLLSALCLGMYCLGLTTHGMANWQEAQRVVVAREMQARGDWLVPTVNGKPYLAKPPMIYWCQLVLASIRRVQVGEFELRLTVAIAGWLGVLGTYLLARRLAVDHHGDEGRAASVAWWSSLFLATGILYARSSRIGELDILLAPFVVLAIGAIHAAWKGWEADSRPRWGAIALATLAATGAALTKGPPGVMVIGLATYGGMALGVGRWPGRKAIVAAGFIGAAALAGAAMTRWDSSRGAASQMRGLFGFALLGGIGGALASRVLTRDALVKLWRLLSHTHPVAVLGVPILSVWGWSRIVAERVGADFVAAAGKLEAEDNLRLLVLDSPINNFEAAMYGCGIGSLLAIPGLIFLWRRSPATRSASIMGAWILLSLVAFSTLGKGVPRYLTPMWPGLAIASGFAIAAWLPMTRHPRMHARNVHIIILLLAIGQGWWYGWGREHWPLESLKGVIGKDEAPSSSRSPRAFIRELMSGPDAPAPGRLGAFEIDHPALDLYAGFAVPALADLVPRPGLIGVGPETIASVKSLLEREGGSYLMLIRDRQPDGMTPELAEARLKAAGFVLEPVAMTSRLRVDNYRTEVRIVRLSLPK